MRMAAMRIHQGVITAITLSKETQVFTQSLTNHSIAIVSFKTNRNMWEHMPRVWDLFPNPLCGEERLSRSFLWIFHSITKVTAWAAPVGISNWLKWAFQYVWYLSLWGKIQVSAILFVKYWISETPEVNAYAKYIWFWDMKYSLVLFVLFNEILNIYAIWYLIGFYIWYMIFNIPVKYTIGWNNNLCIYLYGNTESRALDITQY